MKLARMSFFLLILSACGGTGKTPSYVLKTYGSDVSNLSYNEAAPSPEAKIFLIAGSRQGANFAQEVVDQKNYWLSKGFREDEIACFYVMPDRSNFNEDKVQYLELADAISTCHMASMQNIKKHMAAAEKQEDGFIYIYATSHGGEPTSVEIERERDSETRKQLKIFNATYPSYDQYYLQLDAIPEGTVNMSLILDAIDRGEDPDDLLFTPRYLKKSLNLWPKNARKYVVLQSCHSGGFIESDKNALQKDTLKDVPNITALTASRYDRSSFGCDPGSERTYYGSEYFNVVSEMGTVPDMMDWSAVYKETRSRIQKLEELSYFMPSLPQFYSNIDLSI